MARLGRSQPIQAIRLAARIPATASLGVGSGAGTWTFAGTGSGVAPVLTGPKFNTLADGFASGTIDSKWTSAGAPFVSFGAARLFSGYIRTATYYDLSGSAVHAQPGPSPETGTECLYVVTPDAVTNAAMFSVLNGSLRFRKRVAGVDTDLISAVTYSSTTHKFMRFTESAGAIVFQTSPDATTWTTQTSWTPTWSLAALYMHFSVAASSPTFTSSLDNVNTTTVAGSGTGSWTFAGTGSGKRPAGGSGTGAWSFAGTGSGTRAPKATGAGTWTFAGTGTGKRTPKASGSGTWTFVGTGVGAQPAGGAGTGAWTFVGAGSGEHPRIGAGTGTWTWVGTGEGIAPITPSHIPGAALLAQTLGTATLATVTLGTATLANDGTSTATLTVTVGTATIDTA